MLQRRKMRPDDFVHTSPLDIFYTRLFVFCYTYCTHLIAFQAFLLAENCKFTAKIASKFASQEFGNSLAPIEFAKNL